MKNQRKKGGYTLKNKQKNHSSKSRSKSRSNKVKINRKIPSNTVMNRTFLEIFK